jgi:hypothetical protein
MLQQSLRNLSRALPAVLGVASGLGGFWKEEKEEKEEPQLLQAACFPAGPQRPYVAVKSEEDHKVQYDMTKKEDEE